MSNWGDGTGWRQFTFTGPHRQLHELSSFLMGQAARFISTTSCWSRAAVPGAGTNLIRNGDFEIPLSPPGTSPRMATNYASDQRPGPFRAPAACISSHTRAAAARRRASIQDMLDRSVTNGTLHSQLLVSARQRQRHHLDSHAAGQRSSNPSRQLAPGRSHPGATNSWPQSLPPYPPLWLNEAQPQTWTARPTRCGRRDPWIELHNAGANALSLDGFSLADNYTNLAQWAFPPNAVIQPGQFLVVWADGRPGATTDSEFHTGFRSRPPTAPSSSRARQTARSQFSITSTTRPSPPTAPTAACPTASRSTGRRCTTPRPARRTMAPPRPWWSASTNGWRQNTSYIADPADGDYDDWFELYNPGPLQWTSAAASSPTT